MDIISVRENPECAKEAITYFQSAWNEVDPIIYEDSISCALEADKPLPQWYLLKDHDRIIGCAGLITNDFISRMDLYPWLCALFVEPQYRGRFYSKILISYIKKETERFGFDTLYLATDHVGLYEKLGFVYIAQGYHPWGEQSRIYSIDVRQPSF